jgi:cell division protein FtsZ
LVLMERVMEEATNSGDTNRQLGECRISIIGVGGCGNNTINHITSFGIKSVDCIAVNTDVQHLNFIRADKKLLIGENITKGFGTGNRPETGREAIEENTSTLKKIVQDKDIVFIAAGLGGGTGTGAAPVIAEIAKKAGAMVIGVVTLPFRHEKGKYRYALQGLNTLRRAANTIIVIDNNKLMEMGRTLPMDLALREADSLLGTIVQGVVETITMPSMINLDLADFQTIMSMGGVAIVGIGEAEGNGRAVKAAMKALDHILLDVNCEGADGAIIHISGGEDMSLGEAVQAAETITDLMEDESLVLWGSRIDTSLNGRMKVNIILTGIKSPYIVGGYGLEDLELYNMEPYSGPDLEFSIDLGLYNMECDLN